MQLPGVRCLEDEFDRLDQARAGPFDRGPLAGDVELWAMRDVLVILAMDQGREGARAFHAGWPWRLAA